MSVMEQICHSIQNHDKEGFDDLIDNNELSKEQVQSLFQSHQRSLRANTFNRDFSWLDYYFMVTLLEQGANVNRIPAIGETSLTYACTLNFEDKRIILIRLLLKHGLSWENLITSFDRLLPYDLNKCDNIGPWIKRYLRTLPLLSCPHHVVSLGTARMVHRFLN